METVLLTLEFWYLSEINMLQQLHFLSHRNILSSVCTEIVRSGLNKEETKCMIIMEVVFQLRSKSVLSVQVHKITFFKRVWVFSSFLSGHTGLVTHPHCTMCHGEFQLSAFLSSQEATKWFCTNKQTSGNGQQGTIAYLITNESSP